MWSADPVEPSSPSPPLARLVDHMKTGPAVLLDDSRPAHRAGPSRLFHSPESLIVAHDLNAVPAAMAALDRAVAAGHAVAGWIGYEAGVWAEPSLPRPRHMPGEPLIWLMVAPASETLTPAATAALVAALGDAPTRLALGDGPDRATYDRAFATIQDHIAAGEVYQVNHTYQRPATLSGPPAALYGRVRAHQPVAFGALIHTGGAKPVHVLSFSPELFVRRRGDALTSRPMKGTAPRQPDAPGDLATAAALKADAKSRAENLMIVDLIRNDLARLAAPGSVRVDPLFHVETYPTLHQMTSTVHGRLNADRRDNARLAPSALLRALFPCGSVTGAPKIRAERLIHQMEAAPRGIYCGAIGHFSGGDGAAADWTLSVPIRTLILDRAMDARTHRGRIGLGSGIVADSDAKAEFDECALKAAFLTRTDASAPDLIETLRVAADGSWPLWSRHLARLADSARHFDRPLDPAAAEKAVRAALADARRHAPDHDGPWRVRLTLDAAGRPAATSAAFHDAAPPVWSLDRIDQAADVAVAWASKPLDTTTLPVHHKTTDRAFYDIPFQHAGQAGYGEVLFTNHAGRVTEGAISNLFVRLDGRWCTPPLTDGLLNGILRRTLLENTAALDTAPLTPDMIARAECLAVGNALRGLRRARLHDVRI
ncbi:aminodeoxychorismate synthase component I [Yunchengibacter salinarum]|uniref:aminodeoxychorismate synthase component I n=1 Tax=Yunchengibacter salinarum TaxID=3133399 RepID=UPI0035B667AA